MEKISATTGTDEGEQASSSLEETAHRLLEQLWGRRVETIGGAPTWMSPRGYNTTASPLIITRAGTHLYDGVPGIALSFAASGHVLGDREHKRYAVRTLAPWRKLLADVASSPERISRLRVPVGGLIGCGSWIYCLVTLAVLLEDESLLTDAASLLPILTRERLAAETRLRIQTGAAGTALALLRLRLEATGKASLRRNIDDSLEHCVRVITESQEECLPGFNLWRLSPGMPPVQGLCYGVTGIVHALLRTDESIGLPEARTAAQEGLRFLDSIYTEATAWRDIRYDFGPKRDLPNGFTWRDWWASGAPAGGQSIATVSARQQGPPEPEPFSNTLNLSWCHGSCGIALALSSHDLPRDKVQQVRRSAALATEYLQGQGLIRASAHDPCCGLTGIAESLLEIGLHLEDLEICRAARDGAERLRARVSTLGCFASTAARGTDIHAPGFFQGEAGIAYSLLRLGSHTAKLPCILILK
jgi:lantibiotic modifying enzyme